MASEPVLTAVAVHAHNPGPMTGTGNWTWLLPGRVPTLVDAGTGEPAFLDDLDRALDGAPLAQVLVTHAHRDHVSGAVSLARRFPGARFLKWPWEEQDARWAANWQAIADGDVIDAGDGALQAVHTPGHAPDHLCFWHEPSRTLLCGDLAAKGTTIYIPTTLGGDLAAYLASLDRVLALRPARLLPGHGPVIDDPEDVLVGYIAHRRQREQQIVTALGEGARTAEQLVPVIYHGLQASLVTVARETILAHLVKLEREGRAGRHGDAWHIMEP